MADITAELAALPPKPKHPDYMALRSWDRETERANYHERRCAYFEAHLALAERLLDTTMAELSPALYLAACEEARAYLAHRAKEQP